MVMGAGGERISWVGVVCRWRAADLSMRIPVTETEGEGSIPVSPLTPPTPLDFNREPSLAVGRGGRVVHTYGVEFGKSGREFLFL